jgi:1-acyl-sn-glycerol-3-phosphate acyltransferase
MLHLCTGLAIVLTLYPMAGPAIQHRLRQRWSGHLLAILGAQLQTSGEPIAPGCLLVANHISWLDVFVINALVPSAFIAKAEVRNWPVIGWLAAKNGTVFLKRGSRGHAKIINAEIASLLDAGRNVALFPEGTTTDGSHVLHFHAALLQPAIAAGHAIQPLALSYQLPDTTPTRAPAYDGDLSLGQCIANIIATPAFVASIAVMPVLEVNGRDRRDLARIAHEGISRSIQKTRHSMP